ncbi:nuclear transport factor 2 family protein [Arenibacter sp. M-2]|uniref:nuclear transport factor 2 family protein n=1 Tax=Arenibacter sp. M-2 TaxID=3053612 RepID=UPI002570E06B|nr:nuclear transport factor 2 family protein [Arenibacter sp. M-2]MDL5511116.1 nuclear transport factor 2 family protein [Arenibacter sp. M-2]
MEKIKKAIETFVKGGDNNDVAILDQILHPDYQNIQDGHFEQTGIFVFSKEQYIDLVRTKKFGGHPRTIKYEDVHQMGNIAIAKTMLESDQLKFNSTIVCVLENEQWQVISNIPKIDMTN